MMLKPRTHVNKCPDNIILNSPKLLSIPNKFQG